MKSLKKGSVAMNNKAQERKKGEVFIDYEPRGGWTKEVTPELIEKAKDRCCRVFGQGRGEEVMPFSGALFGFNHPAYTPDYEVQCRLIWRYTLKLKPLAEGESYKKAVMEVLGVRTI